MATTDKILMDGVTTNTDGPVIDIPSSANGADILVQIDITGTITVTVNGRISSAADWIEAISPRTASELVPIAWCPQLRATTTGVSGGSADVLAAIP